ncbi:MULTISPECIES: hypothetical protein [unclassified Arcicella]|uniref:hypothetical protein n=1 Tax=unclassified Arcicella TaxID=2644986 RepID=UPI002854E69D|nr:MULTISPECIES: hypothetical protein [unclassified Arcicella]MDR6561061.1 hypothetical protein [Arcicella sp. BE51]MDR6810945.1 hypothetical protein [Arcicella sp. BE140]MDR6822295.1 hypothetical protein [Arcicella sp. BE139]
MEYRIKQEQLIVAASKQILKSTCLFYRFKDNTTELPIPNGCGILIKQNENYYIFSNAHVLADEYLAKTFIMLGNGEIMTIGGQYFYNEAPSNGGRNKDPIDVTIVKLCKQSIDGLTKCGYDFLDVSNILTNYSISKNDNIMVAGYPNDSIKINNQYKTLIAKPFIFKTKPSLNNLSKLGFHKDFHFVAKYSKNNLFDIGTGKKKVGTKPHGLSGSGFWLLKINSLGYYTPLLIGIFSTYLENRALLVSTKVDIFIEVIKYKINCPN